MGVGRPRKFKSVKALTDAWEQYKEWCNNQSVLTHEFSSKNSEFVSKQLKRSVTCTIEGFCVWAGIARSNFYETYVGDKTFQDITTRIKEECEVDARIKFELGMIDTKLASLWMSKHGYTTKTESNVSGTATKEDNNIFEVIDQSTRGGIDTNAIQEIEPPAESGDDVVE